MTKEAKPRKISNDAVEMHRNDTERLTEKKPPPALRDRPNGITLGQKMPETKEFRLSESRYFLSGKKTPPCNAVVDACLQVILVVRYALDIVALVEAWQPRSCRFMLLRTLKAFPHPGCGHL